MRTYRTIGAELEKARAEYQGAANTAAAPDLAEKSKAIKTLMAELSATISEGAEPCPVCKNLPHGMRKRAGLFEIGCLACTGKAAQGETPEEAVEKWNAGEYIPPRDNASEVEIVTKLKGT